MNVLKKIVIPRSNVTVGYILSELEEMAREEFHRLKKVKEKKAKGKNKGKNPKPDHEGLCPVCIEDLNREEVNTKVKPKLMPAPAQEVYKPATPQLELSAASSWETGAEHVEQLAESNLKLEYIKKHINELITLGKSFVESGVDYIDVEEFLCICEGAKAKLEEALFVNDESTSQYIGDNDTRLEDFKGHLRGVIEIAKDLNVESAVEPSFCDFLQACENIDEKLNTDVKENKSRLQELDSHIDDVVQVTSEYKKQGLLSPSVEEFMKSCKEIKLKIKEYSEQESRLDKINHLKQHVGDLEVLTGEMKKKGLQSKSIDNFSKSCKKFKDKLDSYAKPERNATELSSLIEQIDKTIGLSMEAKDIGIVGDSIEDLVKSSEKLKKKITPVQDTKSKILHSLKINIDDVMGLVDSYKTQGLVTDSVEDFLKTCKVARKKIEGYEILPPRTVTEDEPPCLGRCVSRNESFQTEVIMPEGVDVCKSCHKMYQKDIPTPCESCATEMKEFKLPSDFSICETCSKVNEPIEIAESISGTSEHVPMEVYCDICKKTMKEDHEHEPIPVDSKAGYYERKIRKITKVKRSQNPDGTIREETETISIRKIKREPTKTSLEDDDEDEVSSDDETCVAVCILHDHNQRGFHARLIKSESVLKTNHSQNSVLRNSNSISTL
ncbi:unnamed protein product [Pieris macdunnoughi]|uniref:Uncharacterized protein n=1 Tax=Pieris macdunnoughi TaxID=345717 RepID=A0A821KZ22_9NEOP|nr:unnamed protein product [Pieris macdunnoughi]